MSECILTIKFSPQTPEGLFLKSNFEYLRQNYRKSIKQLNSSPKPPNINENGESISTMFYNNLGCIHFQMNKYNLAAFYFRRALEENDKALATLPPVDKSKLLVVCVRCLISWIPCPIRTDTQGCSVGLADAILAAEQELGQLVTVARASGPFTATVGQLTVNGRPVSLSCGNGIPWCNWKHPFNYITLFDKGIKKLKCPHKHRPQWLS